jgi:hypothetical protein
MDHTPCANNRLVAQCFNNLPIQVGAPDCVHEMMDSVKYVFHRVLKKIEPLCRIMPGLQCRVILLLRSEHRLVQSNWVWEQLWPAGRGSMVLGDSTYNVHLTLPSMLHWLATGALDDDSDWFATSGVQTGVSESGAGASDRLLKWTVVIQTAQREPLYPHQNDTHSKIIQEAIEQCVDWSGAIKPAIRFTQLSLLVGQIEINSCRATE